MAAITSTAVTNVRTWREKPYGNRTVVHRLLDIALSAQGGTSGDIPASVLGFKEIYDAHALLFTAAGPAYSLVPVIVETNRDGLLTIDLTNATDASRTGAANVTGTLRVHVSGLEYNP